MAATQSSLNLPFGVAVDSIGNLYICDAFAQRIRVVNAEGRIDTFAGTGAAGFSGDGGLAQLASFRFNGGGAGIALDRAGNLYIADTDNFRIRVISATTPTIAASTRTLSFTVRAGDAPPPPLQVALTSSVIGLPFSIATSQPFLVATPTGLSAPSTLNITVNPAALTPGTSTGTVTITPGVAGVAPIVIAVTVTVQQPLATRLSVDNTSLPYALAIGAAPAVKRVVVYNAGRDLESFTVNAATTPRGNWLTVTRCPCAASASAPFSLSVTMDPTGLSPGTYSGSIEIRSAGAPIVVTVTATVSAPGQLLRLSQRSLFFLGVVGGGVTPPESIDVFNDGQGALLFGARPVLDPGTPSWLQLTTTPAAITVTANLAGLPPGDHFGRIQVTSPDTETAPREVVVVFRVFAAGTDPGPVLDPVGLVFTSVAGGPAPPSQSITISNVANATISYGTALATFPPNGTFLLYQPNFASIPTGSLNFVVQPNFAGLPAGVYRGTIAFQFDTGSIRTLALLVVIAPAGTTYSTAPKNDPRQTTSGCTVKELLPLVTSLGANFNLPASYPATVNVKVVDNCGAFHTAGTTNVTFSNGDAPLSLDYTKNGVWTQSWQSANPAVAQVTVTASAENVQLSLRGQQEVTGGLSGTADVPFVPRNGIISASSFAPGAPLAPGSMISIYGARLSSGLSQSPRLPLETELAGTRVSIGGRPAPLLFSSDGQINAIAPFATNPAAPASMIVARGTKSTAAIDLPMAAAAPGIFTVSGTGTGQGHVYVAQQLANEANPAKAGDTLVLYCTGLGALDSTVADGGAAPLDRLVRTAEPVTVSIGGIPVEPVVFAGLSPGFAVGLYQVNVVVPPGVARSNATPVTVSVAGQTSPPVTIAVQ